MNATGRPTKLDDLTAKRICDAVATGNTRRCAATAAGVSYATIKHWLQRGRAGEEPFAAFLARLEKADAEAEARAVKVIVDAAQAGTWQAAAWWLERRRSDRWARRETTGAEERTRRDDARVRAASDDELRSSVRQAAAEVLTPGELRVALAEAEARVSRSGGAS
jgi:transposase